MNDIIALAIHDLERRDGTYHVKPANSLLSVSETTQWVIDDLFKLYNRRASKSHGKFTTSDGFPTEGQLKSYIESEERDFLTLTTKMMENLSRMAASRSASEGGHVFFAHIERDGCIFLLVAIVTDKLSAALTANRGMKDVKHLDLDGFRFAGRINITDWAADDDRYISFLKGKGNVSDYFKEFLGCESATLDIKDTTDFVAALKEFASSRNMTDSDRTVFLETSKSICERYSRNREELDFSAFANEIMPRDPDVILEYISDSERKLNDNFVPNRRALKSLVKFRGKTQRWSVEFDREAMNSNVVSFNPDANSLTLFGVPEDLAAALKNDGFSDG